MLQNPLILSVETATRSGSICLTRGDRVLAGIFHEPTTSHSTHLLPAIQEILKTAGCMLDEVELFAAATGPGSFTGLRIGLATVKSFAATLDRKCVGIPTLQAVAHASGPSERTVALLPAGRGELFAQLFAVRSNGRANSIDHAAHLRPADVWNRYANLQRLKWAGEGALAHAPALKEQALANGLAFYEEGTVRTACGSASDERGLESDQAPQDGWTLALPCENLAASVAALALGEFQRENTVRAEDLHAIYVRPSDAEINQRWHNQKLPSR